MKTASPSVVALLASNQFMYADLYTITLQSGTVLYYTDADGGLIFGGNTYTCTSPKIQRDRVKISVGMIVDSLSMTLFAGVTDMIQTVPFPQFIANGGFDGAVVQIDRCFMPTYGDTSAGVVNVFIGRVSDVTPSRTEIRLTISSMMELLNIPMPRNVYSPGCIHNLYDAGCGAIKASYGASTTAASGSTTTVLNCALTQATGYFDMGTITFTSGQNAGTSRTVKNYTVGVFNLIEPLPHTPAISDAFTAYAGCDKTSATCTAKFANVVNFRGFPYIPVPAASM